MKKITLANYTTDTYYPKIVKAVDAALQSENFVSPIGVFIGMGLLEQQVVDEWRKGRVPYLEKVIKCNLAKANRILRILRMHAHDLKLKPSVTVYKRKNKGRETPLQFSKSGERNLEEAYSRHFVKLGKASADKALDPSTRAPALAGASRSGFRPTGVVEGATGLPVGIQTDPSAAARPVSRG
jgi:hypothetical protein